jgi:FkbM family methyltransferase
MSAQGYATPQRLGRGRGGAGRIARHVIDRSSRARGFAKSAPLQSLIRTGRALTIVRGRGPFVLRQLAGRRTARYELRDCGLAVHVRHRSGDLAILNKIFARDAGVSSYGPPPGIAAVLDAAAAPTILDVGANIGLFGVFALSRWPGARMTAYEPDPSNLRVLTCTAAANRARNGWSVVGAAVSNACGEMSFVPELGAMAHKAHGHEGGAITVPAVDLFEQQGDGVDLIKMDIEGGEWAILADPRLADLKARAIRLEWHEQHCPEPDARALAIGLLRAGGFEHVVDGEHEHDRNGVLWAWRDTVIL